MKFSYSWLKQLVDINLPADKLAEFLSLHAFETEVLSRAQEFENIIVAKVTKADKHPNADRLRVITLTDGKNSIGPVVCGAWNFDVGAVVPLALPGATIPHDQHDPDGKPFVLSKATIRGIESQGMICSGKELGLEDNSMGVMVLNSSSKLGESFAVKSESSDTIFDISVPANRPDLTSYRGIAWEISALTGRKYLASLAKSRISNLKSRMLKVRISDTKLCGRFTATRLTNIKIAPSPKFMQDRLKASGLRPINNVVDISNYVMLEVGEPLHAFDASKVIGSLSIRKAYMQESVTTLDGVKRKLNPEMLVVADSKQAIAVAGIMGGAESAVDAHTVEIILEAANFNAASIRRTSRALGLRTDGSSRWEKSLPLSFASIGRDFAIELLEKYASAKVIEFAEAGVKSEKPVAIKLDFEKVNQLLGTEIPPAEQKKILKRLGFQFLNSRFQILVSVPFWRPDVTLWQDLAEEVMRFKGLDYIKQTQTSLPAVSYKDQIIDLLVGLGFDEAYTYSFVPESVFDKYDLDKKTAVEIANPMSSDQKYLRLGIGMNYERLIAQNSGFVSEQNLFEIGNVYRNNNGKIIENTNLFLLCFSKSHQPAAKLVGSIRELCKRLRIEALIEQVDEESANVMVNGENIGAIRAVNEEIKWAAAEINFEKLIKHVQPSEFKSISRYPSKELDVAILVREDLPWGDIKKSIKNNLISSVALFDVYSGKSITTGKKSLAFRIVYQATDRTLTDDEVNKIHRQILDNLKQKFNAQIRD